MQPLRCAFACRFKVLRVLRVGGDLSWQEITFLSLGGLRGSLSLVLAQTIVTLTTSSGHSDESEVGQEVASLKPLSLVLACRQQD